VAEFEFESNIRISREQAGERLIALGKSLMGGARSNLEREGNSIHFNVADELDWEFELNIDGDEVELEIELKWSNRKPAARAARAAPARGTVTPTPKKARAASKRAKGARRASG